MTRHYTLHAPASGIRLTWFWDSTIVIDPGPDKRSRTRHLARERILLGVTVLASVVGLVILQSSSPHDPPWTMAAGLFLGAVACAAIRPGRRAVPPGLIELLEPLRTGVPAGAGEIHRLVWKAAGLIATTELRDGRPVCSDCADCLDQICSRLRALTASCMEPAARSCPTAVSVAPSRRVTVVS